MLTKKLLITIWGFTLLTIVIAGCAIPPPPTPVPSIQPSSTELIVDQSASPTVTNEPTPTEEPQPTPTETPEPSATVVPTPTTAPASSEDKPDWVADAVISQGEYTHFADFTGLRFWWRNDANYLYFVMEGDTTGWVAVGFDPERRMQGANFLFGYYAGNQAQLWDAYGTAPTGPNHPPDEDLGGTIDIVTFAGYEMNGITTFEVQIPLNSGDTYDKPLEPGQTYPYIIAMGGEDNFNGFHLKYAGGELVLDN